MSVVRRIAELAARNRGLVRHTPAGFGKRALKVSPDASLRWLRRDPWREEGAMLLAIDRLVAAGDVVWDLGANVGAFGICAAARSGASLVMVEADPFLAGLLRQTAARNTDLPIEILCCAIGAKAGVARFAIAGRGRSANGLVDGKISSQHGQSREIRLVPTLSADHLLEVFPAPAVVKVDLEGGEGMFMDGARRLLDEVRPSLYIEIHRDNRPALYARFAELGYELRQNLTGPWLPVTDQPPTEDFFAIPAERAGAVFG